MSKNPPIDEDKARTLLATERERIESSLADLTRERQGENPETQQDSDPAETGERLQEGEVDGAVERKLRAELEAVERAEKRLEDGSYGFSVESGEPIPAKRLEAIPWAERTADEQKGIEGV